MPSVPSLGGEAGHRYERRGPRAWHRWFWKPSVLVGEQLRLRLAVGKEACLVPFVPRGPQRRSADIPVRTAPLQHRTKVEAQLLHGRAAEKPVAVVDLVDT